ncbi:hypothetical protein [Endozoicomonas sp. 8E]|uniref:hypothetical protein n=1 Tax=Endozoicomonas sp. 8E TaxID=3035692 RepID=UPI0029393EFB|nr:hypothetical protein [Endozoicomonas sp. 8E]WOG27117.1 hypothetical protein P6910_21580 [Endozoicomonas sp. 8E]
MSLVCQPEPWTVRITADLEQSTGSQKQNFFIKSDRYTLTGIPSGSTEINDHTGSDFPPYDKRHKHIGYEVKTTIIESISWQWLYASNLLIAYEPILTIKDTTLNSNPYSWLPVEVIVGWLLKSYWNPDLPLFNPIEQRAASILRQGGQLFVTITTIFGSGHNTSQRPSSESSGKQAPQANNIPRGYLTHLLYSDFGNGNEGPEQESHTLGLNCFVHPCHGVCQFQPASDNSRPFEWMLNSEENSPNPTEAAPGQSSCPHLMEGHCLSCISDFHSLKVTDSRQILPFDTLNDLPATQSQHASSQTFQPQAHQPGDAQMSWSAPATSNDLIIINGLLNLRKNGSLEETSTSSTPTHLPSPLGTSETQQTTESSQLGQSPPHFSQTDTAQSTNHIVQRSCDVTTDGENGQQQPCGKLFNSIKAVNAHKRRCHTGQQKCDLIVVWEDGQLRPCGTVSKNAQALLYHKRKEHTGQQTCDMPLIDKSGQRLPCGKIFKGSQALSAHKRFSHTGQHTCDLTVVGENNQQRPCGMFCKNAQALTDHKRRHHSGQQTCGVTLIGQDGQKRPCGLVCKNAKALSSHKSSIHRVHQICHTTVIKNGQPQPCGELCRTAKALAGHKSRYHSGQKTCDFIMFREDGQQLPCKKVCNNAQALSYHKRKEHGRKKICDMMVFGEDSQQLPCRKVYNNVKALLYHKRKEHTGQQTCDVTVVGEAGQQLPCGKTCNNIQVLLNHKRACHTGKLTCNLTVAGENDQPQPCGKVCNNAQALTDHKRRHHSGRQICDATVVGKDRRPGPCGAVCKNARTLSAHKSRFHRQQRTCHLTVVGEDGQQRPCGKLFKDAQALSDHKRIHR